MGRRRKGNRKSAKVGPKIHPPSPTATEVRGEWLWQAEEIKTDTEMQETVSTEDLERILGALQDGVRPGPGQEDLDLLADIVCELIERRREKSIREIMDTSRQFWHPTPPRPFPKGYAWTRDPQSDSETLYGPGGKVLHVLAATEIARNPGIKRQLEDIYRVQDSLREYRSHETS